MKPRWGERISIFPKLIMAFLVVLLPLFALSIQMNEQSKTLVRKEITQTIEQRMVSFMSTLELDFNRALGLQTDYVNDDDIDLLSTRDDLSYVDFTEAVSRLQDRLRLMKNATSFVADSFVDISLLGRRISTDGYGEIPTGDGEALNRPSDRFASPFIVHQGKLWITLPYPGTVNRQPVFTLGLAISDASLVAYLNEFTNLQDGGSLLSYDGLAWSVTGGSVEPDVTAAVKERLQAIAQLQHGAQPQRSAQLQASAQPTREQPYAPNSQPYETLKVNGESYFLFSSHSAKLGLSLTVFVKESNIIGPLKLYKDRVWWLSIASFVIVVLFSYWIYRLIHRPLAQLVLSFRKLERGDLDAAMQGRGSGEFSYVFDRFNKTVYRLKELIDEVYVQRYQAKVAELKQLQSQINPHFLYNCFFNLYQTAKMHEIEQVIRVTRSLGEYFRYITRGNDHIRLEEEIKHAQAYADIQEIRFEDQIRVAFDPLPPRWRDREIPKLIVQPLLENAYNHGLEDRDEPGFIHIGFLEEERRLTIYVEDNGDLSEEQLAKIHGLLAQKQSPLENTGLYNVQRRLQLFFGDEGMMTADRSDRGGLRIALRLPADNNGGE